MTYKEIKRDLFTMPSDFYYVHCISSDFALGAGIAKTFRDRGVKTYLKYHYSDTVWHNTGFALRAEMASKTNDSNIVVFNLVTKHHYYDKPTYSSIVESLYDMKRQLPNDCNLAMPCIGCGLDGLNWDQVRLIIMSVFNDTNANIIVCKYK